MKSVFAAWKESPRRLAEQLPTALYQNFESEGPSMFNIVCAKSLASAAVIMTAAL